MQSSHTTLYFITLRAQSSATSMEWDEISSTGFHSKCQHSVIRGRGCSETQLQAKLKRIADGLPVFWLVDGEYDSRCGGLLLDGGQEGKLTFTPEELHHFFCDVWWGVNCSPDIWRNKIKQKSWACAKLFSQAMCCLPPLCPLASNI